MSTLFYYTGMIAWCVIALTLIAFVLSLIWVYLSMIISFWWVRVEAVELNPESDTIKRSFMENPFWKVKVFWLIAKDLKWVIQANGSTLRGDCWEADYTKFVPRVRAWRNS